MFFFQSPCISQDSIDILTWSADSNRKGNSHPHWYWALFYLLPHTHTHTVCVSVLSVTIRNECSKLWCWTKLRKMRKQLIIRKSERSQTSRETFTTIDKAEITAEKRWILKEHGRFNQVCWLFWITTIKCDRKMCWAKQSNIANLPHQLQSTANLDLSIPTQADKKGCFFGFFF